MSRCGRARLTPGSWCLRRRPTVSGRWPHRRALGRTRSGSRRPVRRGVDIVSSATGGSRVRRCPAVRPAGDAASDGHRSTGTAVVLGPAVRPPSPSTGSSTTRAGVRRSAAAGLTGASVPLPPRGDTLDPRLPSGLRPWPLREERCDRVAGPVGMRHPPAGARLSVSHGHRHREHPGAAPGPWPRPRRRMCRKAAPPTVRYPLFRGAGRRPPRPRSRRPHFRSSQPPRLPMYASNRSLLPFNRYREGGTQRRTVPGALSIRQAVDAMSDESPFRLPDAISVVLASSWTFMGDTCTGWAAPAPAPTRLAQGEPSTNETRPTRPST